MILKLNDFNLGKFTALLEESIAVTPEIMIEFKQGMIKSCSYSSTKTLIKLWTIPVAKLMNNPEAEIPQDYFNFYVFKGDSFLKYLSVFDKSSVDLEILIEDVDGKMQAKSITISGNSNVNKTSKLKTTLELTTDEFLTNKVSDYSALLMECTPSSDMEQINLEAHQIIEVKGLVRSLHNSVADNKAFLTFNIGDGNFQVSDKVFNVNLETTSVVKENQEFLILKSDFALIGGHNYLVYTMNDSPKVIFGTNTKEAIVWCMITKYNTVKTINDDLSQEDELSISGYLELDFDI